MVRLISIVSVIISLSLGLIACRAAPTQVPPSPPTSTVPTPPASPPEEKVVVPEATVPPSPVIVTTPPTENVTAPPPAPPAPVLPSRVSLTVNTQSVEIARVTAVFRFDTRSDPGYYYITLLSGNDSFGALEVEWYRATKQISLEWPVYAGRPAYYRLRNDEPVGDIFQTQVSYKKFISLTAIPRDAPSDLEREIVDYVNRERLTRGLSLLAWDDGLYKEALQRLKQFGEEGVILPPRAGQPYPETAYVATGGVGEDAFTISRYWIVNEAYFAIVTNPKAKSFAVRTDTYNNKKFYVVGLFKME